ncbi:MAG: ANTAR domain-containing protein [Ornithinibacter sp.]
MSSTSISAVLAGANAAMVGPDLDITGALAQLLTGVVAALPATAAAVLVDVDDSLEVLAATSHRALDLEMHQAQTDEGPCLDALRGGEEVHEVGAEALARRWPATGPFIVESGYLSVQAMPLSWHGHTFGGLNIFRAQAEGFEHQQADCRALADAVTLLIVSAQVDHEHLATGLHAALEDRSVIEQAKGALAYTRSLDMAEAFDALVALADEEGLTLGVAARGVMARARQGTLSGPRRGS